MSAELDALTTALEHLEAAAAILRGQTTPPLPHPLERALPVRSLRDGDEASRAEYDLQLHPKFLDYTGQNPDVRELNDEGRFFQAAVEAGWVPNTEQGLDTLLVWSREGTMNRDGTPTQYYQNVLDGVEPYAGFFQWKQAWHTGGVA